MNTLPLLCLTLFTLSSLTLTHASTETNVPAPSSSRDINGDLIDVTPVRSADSPTLPAGVPRYVFANRYNRTGDNPHGYEPPYDFQFRKWTI